MMTVWRIETHSMAETGDVAFDDLLGRQHKRIVEAWSALTDAQWGAMSRNSEWTAYQTARHTTDAAAAITAVIAGGERPFPNSPFVPSETPAVWLAQSDRDTPAQTIARYRETTDRLRTTVRSLINERSELSVRSPLGETHWSNLVAHCFWDAWIHERDILLPLGIPPESSVEETQLAAFYGLVAALAPMLLTGAEADVVIGFSDLNAVVRASVSDGQIEVVQVGAVAGGETDDLASAGLMTEAPSLVDALSARGEAIDSVLPGAPEFLGYFAQFLTGSTS